MKEYSKYKPLGMALALLRGGIHRAASALESGDLGRIDEEVGYLSSQINGYRGSAQESDPLSTISYRYRQVGSVDLVLAQSYLRSLKIAKLVLER